MNIRVLVTHSDGTVVVYELDEKQLRLLAEEGITYQLIDLETQIGPQVVYLTRSDNDLEVRFKDDPDEEPDLVIEDHFEYLDSVDLVGESTDGEVYHYTFSTENSDSAMMTYHLSDPYATHTDTSAAEMSETTAASYSLLAMNSQWVALGGVVVLGGLALAAGGGGGGGTSVANIVSGNVSAGPLVDTHGLTINLYGEDGQVLAENVEISANGDFSADIGDYTGPILAKINLDADSIADYHDEGTGAGKDLDTALQAVGYADGNGLTLNVNPVTHLAARQILGQHSTLAEANADQQVIDQANEQTGELLGIDGDVTQQTPQLALDEEGQPTDASDHYGRVLAAIAGAEADRGQTTEEVINELLQGVDEDDPSSFRSDTEGDAARQLLSDGVSKAADAGALTGEEATDTVESIVVDTEAPPSVTTTAVDQLINAEDVANGEASLRIRFKFNRAPAEGEFTSEDIWVNGQPHEGIITDLRVDENDPTVYWASFTPTEEDEFVVGVPAGSYTTTDGEENIAGLDVSITRDVTAPPAPEVRLGEGQDDLFGSQDDMVEIIVSTSGLRLGDQIQLYLGSALLGSAQTVTQASLDEGGVSFMWPINVLGEDGDKIVSGRVTDRAGNEGEVSAPLMFTLDTTISTQPLQLSLANDQDEYINAYEEFVTLIVTLGVDAIVGDDIQLKINENEYSTYYTLTTEDISAGEVTLSLPVVDLGADGEKTLTARLIDEAGNLGPGSDSESVSFRLDTTPPTAPVISLLDDTGSNNEDHITTNGYLNVTYDTDDVVEVRYFVTRDGGEEQQSMSAAQYQDFIDALINNGDDGPITVRVELEDMAGNTSGDTISYILDVTAPTFDIEGSVSTIVLVGVDEVFDHNVSDDNTGVVFSIASSLDGELFQIDPSTGVVSFIETTSTVGTYRLTVIATDAAGNQAEQNLTVDVVETPIVTITDNIVEEVTSATTVEFTFTFSEPVSDFTFHRINIEGGTADESDFGGSGTSYRLVVTTIPNSDYRELRVTIPASAVTGDDSGLFVESNSHSQFYDHVAPTETPNAAIVDNGQSSSDSITSAETVMAPTTNAGTITQYRLVNSATGGNDIAEYDWQETYEAPDSSGNYNLEVRQLDAAGNSSPIQTINFDFVAGAFDYIVEQGISRIDETNNIIEIDFGDIIDSSNTIDPSQFTVVIDGLEVGITNLSVLDGNFERGLEITVDVSLGGLESAIVTYIAGDDPASRVTNQFGESFASG